MVHATVFIFLHINQFIHRVDVKIRVNIQGVRQGVSKVNVGRKYKKEEMKNRKFTDK